MFKKKCLSYEEDGAALCSSYKDTQVGGWVAGVAVVCGGKTGIFMIMMVFEMIVIVMIIIMMMIIIIKLIFDIVGRVRNKKVASGFNR